MLRRGHQRQTGDGLLRAAETRPQILYSSGGILATTALGTNGSTTCAGLSNASVVC